MARRGYWGRGKGRRQVNVWCCPRRITLIEALATSIGKHNKRISLLPPTLKGYKNRNLLTVWSPSRP
jgi:hypothetical protein